MISKLQTTYNLYPRQFWLLFWGMFLNSTGASMVWPFLLLYVSKKLDLPLTAVASLLTISTIASVISSFVAGQIADRVGRKGVMVVSLFVDAINFLLLARADSYIEFAILLAMRGFSNPLYRVGADAMLADLVEPEKRMDAYALTRMITNAGIAIGPVIGGFAAGVSYSLSFLGAAIGLGSFGLLLALFARETLQKNGAPASGRARDALGGYLVIWRDRVFILFTGLLSVGWITASLIWQIMPYYANKNFDVPEQQYGWIPTTNAAMVVFLQLAVTQWTRKYLPPRMAALGMFFYAVGNGLVFFATGFWGFWLCMVTMTVGELVIVPTSNTFVANRAPADMRGRYMSIYGLTQMIAIGIGPVFGGLLNDNFGPHSIWIGGLLVGLTSAAGLLLLSLRIEQAQRVEDAS
jgi:MFS family permease